jgi:hypothetical protein
VAVEHKVLGEEDAKGVRKEERSGEAKGSHGTRSELERASAEKPSFGAPHPDSGERKRGAHWDAGRFET